MAGKKFGFIDTKTTSSTKLKKKMYMSVDMFAQLKHINTFADAFPSIFKLIKPNYIKSPPSPVIETSLRSYYRSLHSGRYQ